MLSNKDKKVFVGLSGGVDSSVAAKLLIEQGFLVTGVFIKTWQPDFLECTWKDDRLDAMRVCAKLKIPFLELDLEKEYKKEVIDYMVREYKEGKTPNPDIMCNKYVKFGAFYDFALNSGADYIATGHYCSIGKSDNNFLLKKAIDTNKDQSYFLYTLSGEKLKNIIFPIGSLLKSEVRDLAKKFGLHTAEKRDSQGLCFVGSIDIKEFLKKYIEEKDGDVLSEGGALIGRHIGSIFLTIGERHGFTINEKTNHDKPYYIIGKDTKNNTITVAHKNKEIDNNLKNIVIIKDIILNNKIQENKIYQARCRYREKLKDCKIKALGDNILEIMFLEPVLASSGQSVVVYDGELCLGGGILE